MAAIATCVAFGARSRTFIEDGAVHRPGPAREGLGRGVFAVGAMLRYPFNHLGERRQRPVALRAPGPPVRCLRLSVGALVLGTAMLLASAQAPRPVDTSGWKTLRDGAMGFEVKYPATWHVGRSTGTLESLVLGMPAQAGTERVSMQLFVQRGINPRGLPIEQWYADQLARLHVTAPPPATRTVIGGRPTIRREMTGTLSRHFDFYTAVKGSDIFQVSILQPTAQAQLDPTHEAVVSTIAFVP